jgi:hypothetical protein
MFLPPSLRFAIFALTGAVVAAGCAGGSDADEPVGETYQSFSAWKASLPRDPNDGAYLVDGDLGIHDEAALQDYFASRGQPDALIVATRPDGTDDKWSETQRKNLTYCVSPAFGADHDNVVAAMDAAARDWESAADVRFIYRGENDEACTPRDNGVVFQVLPARNTPYNGRSFLPGLASHGDHTLMVDMANVARAAPKTLTGVLRHELGHVLGFRHEHTRPESNGACIESPDWRPLTPYDAMSVMHYNAMSRCEGANTGDYVLTALDIEGARSLYGAP